MIDTLFALIWLLLQVVVAIIFAYILLITALHIRAVRHLNFYERQGATLYPGCKSFFFGNMWDMIEYQRAYVSEDIVTPGPQQWLAIDYFVRKMGYGPEKRYDGKEFPFIALNFQTVTHVWVADPEIAQDIFVGKNALLDKDAESLIMFDDIIGSSFLFAHNDDHWKTKRKACAHAFYKDRLVVMLETLKELTHMTFAKWMEEAKRKGHHEVDMATEFSEILTRNIIHVSFGEDLSDNLITLMVKEGDRYVSKEMAIKDAIFVLIGQVCFSFYANVTNPINWLYPYIDFVLPLSSESKIVK